MKLFEREIIKSVRKFISSEDIIVFHGARQVGKTCILRYIEKELKNSKKDTFYIDLENLQFLELLNSGPQNLIKYLEENGILKKDRLYLFIDEIQYLNNPTNFLKLCRDHYSDRLKLFVSGSSSFEIKSKFRDSLAGRTLNFEIYPLSFKEFLLFKNYDINLYNRIVIDKTIKELVELFKEYVLYGGYPRIVLEKEVSNKEIYLQQVIDTYVRKDIRDLGNVKDILKFNKLLEVLASQTGQMMNIVELSNTTGLSRTTVEHYLFLMENTYIIKLLRPFSSNIRSELFKTPKVFFYDSGLVQLLHLKSFPKTILGNVFETAIFSEFIKNFRDCELFYWRTQDKKEIDFIIKKGKELFPVEVKLRSSSFSPTGINYFSKKYRTKKSLCVSLEIGKSKHKNVSFIYPWEIYREHSQIKVVSGE